MRKLFLLGTMLGVASAAFAFGGMFSHGSKSTTYKGGVNAIGVHFGGEKKNANSEPKEATCPADRKCGDYCCGEGHTCQDGQCCDGNGHCCASSGYSTETEACCNVNYKTYISHYMRYWTNKENIIQETACCEGIVFLASGSKDSSFYEQTCCPADSTGIDDTHQCCRADEIVTQDWNGGTHCCPAGSTGYAEGNPDDENTVPQCCVAGTIMMMMWPGEYVFCCPSDSPGIADGQCCESGTIIIQDEEENGHCCPADSTGWGSDGCCEPGTQPTEDPDGETHCCPNGWDEDNWECA